MSSPAQRLLLCFVVGLGLLVNVRSAYRAWAARVGLDLAELPELEGRVAQGERDAAEKDRESHRFAALAQARHEIAGEVIRGRMGPFEAAARFRDTNAARADGGPDGARHLRRLVRRAVLPAGHLLGGRQARGGIAGAGGWRDHPAGGGASGALSPAGGDSPPPVSASPARRGVVVAGVAGRTLTSYFGRLKM